MAKIEFKVATIEDAPVIFSLLEKLSQDLDKENEFSGSVKALEKYGFSEPSAFEAILASQNNKPLGLILFFYEFSTWRGKPGLFIQDLYVSPKARGLGLGAGLIKEAIKRGQLKDVVYVDLAVHNSNTDTFGFYENIGFIEINDKKTFLLEGKPFDMMRENK